MTTDQAKTITLVAGGLMAATALMQPEGQRYRRLWASGLATVLLAVTAEFVPQVTGPLAVVIALGLVAGIFDKLGTAKGVTQ